MYHHFACRHGDGDAATQALPKQIGQHQRRITGRVARHEQKQRIVRQDADAHVQQIQQVVVDFEQLLIRAASKARRIQQDAVVFPPATLFTQQELLHVIDDPADGSLLQVVQLHVPMGPVNHFFGSVQMADFAAVLRQRHRRAARIGEQIQHGWTAARLIDESGHPIPAKFMFGEDAHMAEIRRRDFERHLPYFACPAFRQTPRECPMVALLPREETIRLPPDVRRKRRTPNGLGTRAVQNIVAEALQFPPRPAV